MSNDWEKDLDAYLDSIPGLPKEPTRRDFAQNGDIDITNMLAQRIMQKATQQGNVPIKHSSSEPNVSSGPEKVLVREGGEYYTSVPNEMSNIPVALKAGLLENVSNKEFMFKGYVNCLLIENHQAIDLSKIDSSKLTRMCLVEAMWVGTIVVPESSIVRIGRNNGAQVLKG